MADRDFAWIIRSEDADGRCLAFQLYDDVLAPNHGDLVEVDGEIFPVVEGCYIEKDSPEARLINELANVRFVNAIYRKEWEKNG